MGSNYWGCILVGKPSSGGGSSLFSLSIYGPPPGNATTGSEQWINLGVIPSGQRFWFGSAVYTSTDKAITFELRTNLITKSASTIADTALLGATAVSTRTQTTQADYYKNGSLHITSVIGTGVEHAWLRLISKSSTATSYLFTINYRIE